MARNRIDPKPIITRCEDILRVAGSLSTGTVRASELLRVLQGGGRPTPPGRAIAELGRVAKTLHLLSIIDSEPYRRSMGIHINRHEGRHSVARAIFYGNRGELRRPYRQGQEDQLAALASRLTSSRSGTSSTWTTASRSSAPSTSRSPKASLPDDGAR